MRHMISVSKKFFFYDSDFQKSIFDNYNITNLYQRNEENDSADD